MKLGIKVAIREISGSYYAVAVGRDSERFNGMIKVNKTGRDMIELLEDDISKEEIVEKMLEKYDATREDIEVSLDKLISVLDSYGILEK